MENKEYWIYKITNIENDKIYIGHTNGHIISRFCQHITFALNKKHDYNKDIDIYPNNKFMLEIRKIIEDEKKNIFEVMKIELIEKKTCWYREILELETKHIINNNWIGGGYNSILSYKLSE